MKKIPYSIAIDNLIYVMIGTRLDMTYAFSLVNKFMSKPCEEHCNETNQPLRYFERSCDFGLIYCADKTTQFLVEGFCDFDYTADLDKKRLLIGYIFTFARNIMNQKNCLQHIVALLTTGTKYIALTEAIKEVL